MEDSRRKERKKTLYIDMDNVLVDFPSGIDKLDEEARLKYVENYDNAPGIFALMKPVSGAIEVFNKLADKYDVYILSTAPWENPSAWSDKLKWVKTHLGENAYKRLILTHRKDLHIGDYLIDDRKKNGAGNFKGELILFGSSRFRDWKAVEDYFLRTGTD
jgi:5'(3')-deoxyribonucleotidase